VTTKFQKHPKEPKTLFGALTAAQAGAVCRKSLSRCGNKAARVYCYGRVPLFGAKIGVDEAKGKQSRMAIANIRRRIVCSKIAGGRGVVALLGGVDVEMSGCLLFCFV
jgi:hypothetical protein